MGGPGLPDCHASIVLGPKGSGTKLFSPLLSESHGPAVGLWFDLSRGHALINSGGLAPSTPKTPRATRGQLLPGHEAGRSAIHHHHWRQCLCGILWLRAVPGQMAMRLLRL
jgi:hypothetical protein